MKLKILNYIFICVGNSSRRFSCPRYEIEFCNETCIFLTENVQKISPTILYSKHELNKILKFG